jgi:hypothetical protein
MFSTLTIALRYAELYRVGFHRVVSLAKPTGVEKHTQNLDVVLGCYAGDDDADDEQADSSQQ